MADAPGPAAQQRALRARRASATARRKPRCPARPAAASRAAAWPVPPARRPAKPRPWHAIPKRSLRQVRRSGGGPATCVGGRTRRRRMRRGSTSSTSNSTPDGWRTTSPRSGMRPSRREDQAAHRVDLAPLVLRQHAADLLLEQLDGRAAVDVDACRRRGAATVGVWATSCSSSISPTISSTRSSMVSKPVGAAELVDHQRHVGARAAHVEQHVEHRQGRRHEHHAAQYVAQVEFLRRCPSRPARP